MTRSAGSSSRSRAERERDTFFDVSMDPLAVLSLDGCFEQANAAWGNVIGLSERELAGRSFLDFVHPEDRERTRREMDRLAAERRTGELEIRWLTGHGDPRWFLWRAVPDVEVDLVYIVARDVTEQKRHEAEREDLVRELERSNRELQLFAYVASHDLQEPLRMVTSYLELLERRYAEKLDEPAREFIAFAVDGAARMKQLIQALLAYSRIGTRGLEPEAIAAAEAVARARRSLAMKIEETGAEIQVDPLPVVMADPGQLTQLFQNLLENAVKFSSDGEPAIRVFAAEAERPGWTTLAVRDSGLGIEPRHVDRIFRIFQRLNPIEEYPGTGIGLAICQRIVERHGGRIWVDSTPGEGATFSFTLPLAEAS